MVEIEHWDGGGWVYEAGPIQSDASGNWKINIGRQTV